jgi:hypothetical protein
MQADAAGEAADAQRQATEAGIAEQRRQFNLSRADLEPWRTTGTAAINKLGHYLGLGDGTGNASAKRDWQSFYDEYLKKAPMIESPNGGGQWVTAPQASDGGGGGGTGGSEIWVKGAGSTADTAWAKAEADKAFAAQSGAASATPDSDFGLLTRKFSVGDFYADPVTELGLQFGLDEGRKGITRMAGARGNRDSGETLKALTKFGSDYTGTKAGESYLRFVNDQTNIYNRLAGVAGTGQNAANTTGALGANAANNISNMYTAQGNARGAASIAQGNAYGGAGASIGNYYNQQQTLDKILNRGGGGSSYNSAGTFQPYYTGYDSSGGPAYG